MRTFGAMHSEKCLDFRQDPVERPRLVTRPRRDRIAMHRIATPHHRAAGLGHRADQLRQLVHDLVGAEPADQRQPPWLVLRVENIDQTQQPIGLEAWSALETDRIANTAAELDMRVVGLAGAIADPEHVARCRVPFAGRRIEPGHCLLEAQQQSLVARVEIRRAQLRRILGRDSAGTHEAHCLGDAARQFLIAVAGWAVLDETEVPLVHALEVGIAAHCECADQVEGRRRLPVGLDLTLRIGRARVRRELRPVYDIAAIARQLD